MGKHVQTETKNTKASAKTAKKRSTGSLGLVAFLLLAAGSGLLFLLFGNGDSGQAPEANPSSDPAVVSTAPTESAAIVWDTETVLYEDDDTTIVMRGDEEMDTEYGRDFIDPCVEIRRSGSFGLSESSELVYAVEQMPTDTIGKFKIHYLVVCNGEEMRFERYVNVVDTTPPQISVSYPENVEAGSWMKGTTEPDVSAYDLLDGDLSDKVKITHLDGKTIYSVSDSNNNEAVLETDPPAGSLPPEIVLTGGGDYTFTAAMDWVEPGWSVTDSDGADLSELVQVSGSVVPYKLGDYTLSYQLSNGRGDTARATRTVHVVAAERKEAVIPEQKTIYLTFDDGPGPYTDQLLDLLAKYDVKATFFVTGNYPDYYDCIGRAYREGHTIAVHTFSHNYRQIYRGVQAYFDDFKACEELIYEQTGTYTTLFRFPGGSSNTVSSFNPGIMGLLATYMRDMGYYYFDWNVSSGDAQTVQIPTYDVYRNVIKGCAQYDTNVVLQHDVKGFSVAAVEDIIKWGLENGYQFLPLQEDSYGARHWIYN